MKCLCQIEKVETRVKFAIWLRREKTRVGRMELTFFQSAIKQIPIN